MILIAESGSTRTEWAVADNGEILERAFTEGINPYFQNRREISHSVRLGLPEAFFRRRYEQVRFYGAGCGSPEKNAILRASLVAQFRSVVMVESDLLAAARGLFGHEDGIACILGTGSNSCLYEGERIVHNVRPGGYILGDEGSGARLGRLFLSDVLKDLAPHTVATCLLARLGCAVDDLMDTVYNRPFPNSFLASVGTALADHLNDPYVLRLVEDNLRSFFARSVCQYDGYRHRTIRFVGSQACLYAPLVRQVAREFDITPDAIVATPMDGLVRYHAG